MTFAHVYNEIQITTIIQVKIYKLYIIKKRSNNKSNNEGGLKLNRIFYSTS